MMVMVMVMGRWQGLGSEEADACPSAQRGKDGDDDDGGGDDGKDGDGYVEMGRQVASLGLGEQMLATDRHKGATQPAPD